MLDGFKSDVLYLYSKFNLEIFIMKITNPELKVVRFNADDVIATSIGALTGKTGLFYVDNGNGGYDSFNGEFGEFNASLYEITGLYAWEYNVGGDRDRLISAKNGGMVYMPDVGYPIPASVLAQNAPQTYDANLDSGVYYSNGVSYYEQYWNQ